MYQSLRNTLIVLSICFVAMLAWLTTFTVMAFGVREPMVDRAYYRKGMNYQKRLDAFARGRAQGWTLKASGPVDGGNLKVGDANVKVLLLNPRSGTRSKKTILHATLERPASTLGSKRYRVVAKRVRRDGAREFDLRLRIPSPGYWELMLEAQVVQELKSGAPAGDTRVYRRYRFYAR